MEYKHKIEILENNIECLQSENGELREVIRKLGYRYEILYDLAEYYANEDFWDFDYENVFKGDQDDQNNDNFYGYDKAKDLLTRLGKK